MGEALLDIPACDIRAVCRLEAELGVSHVVGQVLVRRGLTDPDAARAWLAADAAHDPFLIRGMREACEIILRHVRGGSRIAVHGDYDVDGVCSTAILVSALRRMGADVHAVLPSRTEDGYGLARHTVDRLAERGTGLLITADCAITAVDEVAAARAAGIEVVVTDHHQPRADGRLPDAPIVHPGLGGYPCPELCAAGVAHKVVAALLTCAGEDPAGADADLDLVALATVADCVPLVDENRRLVRAGLRAIRASDRPGLRALMRVAQVEPARVDARAIGFRLAPRLNAAGRMYRADAALELLLTEDADRATAVADELDRINAERRHAEQRILFEAEAQVRDLGDRRAYVLWGEGWHKGVIGIVASRIAERHHRPVVLVALDGDRGTGSGRSIPAFDLLAGLEASREHLLRHGGHRAAAGCEVAATALPAFRAAFEAHATAVLSEEDLLPRERVDAVVAGDELGLALAEELQQLEPLGMGNPVVRLLLPAARVSDCRPLGDSGKHVRCTVTSGGYPASAVGFGMASVPTDGPVDVVAELELHTWRGAVEPRVLLRCAIPAVGGTVTTVGEPEDAWSAVLAGIDRALPVGVPGVVGGCDAPWPEARDRRGGGIAGVLGALVHSGERVLAVVADAEVRGRQLQAMLGGFELCSHAALADTPALADGVDHVVVIDPPATPAQRSMLEALTVRQMVHLAWGPAELTFALRIHEREYDLRAPLTALYRDLRARNGAAGEELEAALRGDPQAHRSLHMTGRAMRVLTELGLVSLDSETRTVTVPPAQRTELERSAAFRCYTQQLEDGRAFLSSATAVAA
ncbi:MAG: single-stranded-DNA-specific exonuclease RecJ [Solirubrobacteraceae bacterium]|nr:single-stranded-DNA-specific exonuclease RecJ [Solirubrobacteraceae bacterium]